jgi:hypothetical protein
MPKPGDKRRMTVQHLGKLVFLRDCIGLRRRNDLTMAEQEFAEELLSSIDAAVKAHEEITGVPVRD